MAVLESRAVGIAQWRFRSEACSDLKRISERREELRRKLATFDAGGACSDEQTLYFAA